MLRFMGLQRVGHDWATDLIWSDSTLKIAVVQYNSWNTGTGIRWTGKNSYWLEEGEEEEDGRAEGSIAIGERGQAVMSLTWRWWNACVHLWKLATWRFVCRGFNCISSCSQDNSSISNSHVDNQISYFLYFHGFVLQYYKQHHYSLKMVTSDASLILPFSLYSTSNLSLDTVCVSCSVVSDSFQPIRHLCPWDSPDKNTGVGCHFLLQGIFLTQGSIQHLSSFSDLPPIISF